VSITQNNKLTHRSLEAISEALNSSTGLPAAIDHLLSVELISTVEKEGAWPEDADDSGAEEWQIPNKPLSKPQSPSLSRSSSRSRKKGRTIPLVDTLQRKPSPIPSRPSSRSTSQTRATKAVAGPSSNSWLTMSTLADYLKFCHSPKYHSAYSAIRASLAALPSSNKSNQDEEERSKSILEEMYGVSLMNGSSGKFQEDLEICVDITGGDLTTIMDIMDLLDEISQWPGDDEFEPEVELKRNVPETKHISMDMIRPAIEIEKAVEEIKRSSVDIDRPSIPIPKSPKISAPPIINPNRITQRPVVNSVTTTERVIPGAQASKTASNPVSAQSETSLEPPPSPKAAAIRAMKSSRHPAGIQHVQNWRTVAHVRRPRSSLTSHPNAPSIPSYARGALPNESYSSSSSTLISTAPSFDDCIARAGLERIKREEAVRNAGRYFRSTIGGKKHGALVAGHYASQAREAQEKARQWELKAARMVLQQQIFFFLL